MQREFDLVVLGAGPGGYSCAFRAADLGLKTAIIERHKTLGGVCLNVGCIPSKALLHAAHLINIPEEAKNLGISFPKAKIDLNKLREHKDNIVHKLTSGLSTMAKMRKVEIINAQAKFASQNSFILDNGETIIFKKAVIAAGSEAIKLPFMPDDERIINSTGALKLEKIPKKMLIIGGGIIGLEMATVYKALGSEIDLAEAMTDIMTGVDNDLLDIWKKQNSNLFNNLMTETFAKQAEAKNDGIYVNFEGKNAPKNPQKYDCVLVGVGRKPNGFNIDAHKAGVKVDEKGFIPVDKQMRTNQNHIFAIGDIVGQPMLAHKATHQAHVAAEAASGKKAFFDARVIPSVAYTAPEVAWVGITQKEAEEKKLAVKIAKFPWSASGRAYANSCEFGLTKLIIDSETGRILGAGIIGNSAGDMISELALAIEMNATAEDIALSIHPHPTLGETIAMAAEVFEKTCTDLPPQK